MNLIKTKQKIQQNEVKNLQIESFITNLENHLKEYYSTIQTIIENENLYVPTEDPSKKFKLLGDISDTKEYKFKSEYLYTNDSFISKSISSINKSIDSISKHLEIASVANGEQKCQMYNSHGVLETITSSNSISTLDKFTFYINLYFRLLDEKDDYNYFEKELLDNITDALAQNDLINISFQIAEDYLEAKNKNYKNVINKMKSETINDIENNTKKWELILQNINGFIKDNKYSIDIISKIISHISNFK